MPRSKTLQARKRKDGVIIISRKSKGKSRVHRPLPNPIAHSRLVRMRYVETVNVDPAIGSVGTYQFRASDVFDPNATGGGHQPYGHDTYQTLYQKYIVVSSKISVKFWSTGVTANTSCANVGILLKDNNNAETNLTLWMERPNTSFKTLGPVTGPNSYQQLSKTFNAKKFFSLKDIKDNVDAYGSDFGDTPPDVAYYQIVVAPAQSTLDISNVYMTVVIDYNVLCLKPIDIAQS